MPDCFTTYCTGLPRQLINKIDIASHFDAKGNIASPLGEVHLRWNALWDTGAMSTCITHKVAETLNLIPMGKMRVHGANGVGDANSYCVDIYLPNKVLVKSVTVAEPRFSEEGCNFDAIIGMDIISLGDFFVSNYNKKTIFTFRYPSMAAYDFLQHSYLVPTQIPQMPLRNDTCPCGSGLKYKNCCGK